MKALAQDLRSKLTLVIPSRNRAKYLYRALEYLLERGFTGRVMVADSSDNGNEWLGDLSKRFQNRIDLYCHSYPPDMPVLDKVRAGIALVDSPYVALSADDDFVVPSALNAGVSLLAEQPTCSATHGHAVTFTLRNGEVRGKIDDVLNYPQRSIEGDSASIRLLDHLADYTTTWYSVRRTTDLVADWDAVVTVSIRDLYLVELFLSSLCVIRGQVVKMRRLYMARQCETPKQYQMPRHPVEWLGGQRWPQEYQCFRDYLAKRLCEIDRISDQQATEVVRNAMGAYLARYLSSTYPTNTIGTTRVSTRLKSKIAQAPGAKWLRAALLRGRQLRRDARSILRRIHPTSDFDSSELEAIYRGIAPSSGE